MPRLGRRSLHESRIGRLSLTQEITQQFTNSKNYPTSLLAKDFVKTLRSSKGLG